MIRGLRETFQCWWCWCFKMTPKNHLAVNIGPPSLWSTKRICYSEKTVRRDAPKTEHGSAQNREKQWWTREYEGDTGALFRHKMLTKAVRRTWWPSLTSPWTNKDTIYGIDSHHHFPTDFISSQHWLYVVHRATPTYSAAVKYMQTEPNSLAMLGKASTHISVSLDHQSSSSSMTRQFGLWWCAYYLATWTLWWFCNLGLVQ